RGRAGAREIRAGPPRLAGTARGEPRGHRRYGHRRHHRPCTRAMIQQQAEAPLVTLAEIAEIELFTVKRKREFTLGDHASVFKGAGFNFVGIRDWAPGDRISSIDWAQSSLNNFSPLITREFEQDSTATVIAVADAS